MTIAASRIALSTFVVDTISDPNARKELSRLTASYIAAIVPEERRSAAEDKRRALEAMVAADKARQSDTPFDDIIRKWAKL